MAKLVTLNQAEKGGAELYRFAGIPYGYGGELSTLVCGDSGAGKTTRYCMNLMYYLSQVGESFIATDCKGDILKETANYIDEDKYDLIIYNLKEPLKTMYGYNPLEWIRDLMLSKDKVKKSLGEKFLGNLGDMIFPKEAGGNDPYWQLSSKTVFMALATLLIRNAPKEQCTLESVYRMILQAEKRIGGKMLLEVFIEEAEEKESRDAQELYSFLFGPTDTRHSTRSVLLEGLAPYVRSDLMTEFMAKQNVTLDALENDKPKAIYIAIDDHSREFHPLASLILSQYIQYFFWSADNAEELKLKYRLNVLLEELGQMGGIMPDLDLWVTSGRSRNIRFHLVLQSPNTQLTALYGESKAETVIDNCGVIVCFRSLNLNAVRNICCKTGDYKDEETGEVKPLITPHQISSFEPGRALIIVEGTVKFVTKLCPHWEVFQSKPWKWEMPEAKEITMPQPFDMETYVTNIKISRIDSMLKEWDSEREESVKRPPIMGIYPDDFDEFDPFK